MPASIKGRYIIRFTVTSTHTKEVDIRRDWAIVQALARRVLIDMGKEEEDEEAEESVPEEISSVISNVGQIRREGMKRKDYGLSLILSNVPMSPKFINGSFAAMFDNADNIAEYARHLSRRSIDFNGQPIRLSPRKRLKEQNKQYSFDLSQRQVESAPRRQHAQRQASLDSKIEEIFENSLEDPRADHNGDDLYDDAEGEQHEEGDGFVGGGQEDAAYVTEDGQNGGDGVVTVGLYSSAAKARLTRAAPHLVDKAVQSPTSPPPYQPLEATDGSARLDSPSDNVQVSLALSPSAINGLTPLICKHCGHAVED